MTGKKEPKGRLLNPERVGTGVLVCTGLMLGLTAAGAWLICAEVIGEMWINYLAAGTLLISGFAGGCAAGKGEWKANPLAAGAVFWLILLGINLILFRGTVPGAVGALVPVLGGSGASLLIQPGKKRRTRRMGHRHRR